MVAYMRVHLHGVFEAGLCSRALLNVCRCAHVLLLWRLTRATQALDHPWVRDTDALPDENIGADVVKSLTQFSATNRMRKEALRMVATTLSAADVRRLRTAFNTMDSNTDNVICIRELGDAIAKMDMGVDIGDLMRHLDLDGDGLIDLNEFLLATAEVRRAGGGGGGGGTPPETQTPVRLRTGNVLRTSTMCGGRFVRWTKTGCAPSPPPARSLARAAVAAAR